jgi:branched-chain amino acid transport system ATP-binding protein
MAKVFQKHRRDCFMTHHLRVQGLRQNYGGVQALKGIDFELSLGECVAMIGPNGAGKSTCFGCLAGQQHAAQGQIFWQGQEISQLPVETRRGLGLARTFQVAQVFEALTVLQNLQLVLQAKRGVSVRDILDHCALDEAWHWIRHAGLMDLGEEMLQGPAAHLSYGDKKRLELAMAMAGLPNASEGLMLLDEPAAGMSDQEVRRTADLILEINKSHALIVVEHDMSFIRMIAKMVTVFHQGAILTEDLPDAVMKNPTVRQVYLGKKAA